MNILLDIFGFTRKLEGILNDTVYIEVPSSIFIRGYTENENESCLNFWKFKKTSEKIGNLIVFKLMKSIDNAEDIEELPRFFVAMQYPIGQYPAKKEKPTSYGYA